MFDRIGIAVQDLERDLRGRRKALVSHIQRTPIDSAGQHRTDREMWLAVLYPLPKSLFGRDFGSKVGDHKFLHWRKSSGDVPGQVQCLLVILIRRHCIRSTVCLQRANRSGGRSQYESLHTWLLGRGLQATQCPGHGGLEQLVWCDVYAPD